MDPNYFKKQLNAEPICPIADAIYSDSTMKEDFTRLVYTRCQSSLPPTIFHLQITIGTEQPREAKSSNWYNDMVTPFLDFFYKGGVSKWLGENESHSLDDLGLIS
ncbi:TPA: hypothetical protein I8Y83_002744 [Legionella pneumophila]|nr:hypothetical protein [Legionella pneumophila]